MLILPMLADVILCQYVDSAWLRLKRVRKESIVRTSDSPNYKGDFIALSLIINLSESKSDRLFVSSNRT